MLKTLSGNCRQNCASLVPVAFDTRRTQPIPDAVLSDIAGPAASQQKRSVMRLFERERAANRADHRDERTGRSRRRTNHLQCFDSNRKTEPDRCGNSIAQRPRREDDSFSRDVSP